MAEAASQMRTWLVTGANRGIGLELVRQLASDSSNIVFACCRDIVGAKALHTLGGDITKSVHVVEIDVADPASISSSVGPLRSLLEKYGLDYLINNAGVNPGFDDVFETMTAEMLTEVFQVNVIGPALIAQAYLPFLEKPGKRGVIMNVSSGLASNEFIKAGSSDAKCPAYSISKAALNMLTSKQARARESLISFSIDPGWVKTDMGGPGAHLEPAESVRGLLKVLKSADRSYTGKFFKYNGELLPW